MNKNIQNQQIHEMFAILEEEKFVKFVFLTDRFNCTESQVVYV